MSECKFRASDGECLREKEFPYKEFCVDGPCQHYTVQTNADRIRAMTDEELAKWLDDISKACYYEGYTKETDEPQMSPYPTSPSKWVKWLKQEVDG